MTTETFEFKNSLLIEHNQNNHYSSFAVANFILDYLRSLQLTNLKLQKLIFLSYGLHLSLYNEKLFSDSIEAWKLGPVVKPVYLEFTTYGSESITTRAKINEDLIEDSFQTPEVPNSCEKEKLSIISTCLYYGSKTAAQLVDITHNMHAWQVSQNAADKILQDKDILQDFAAGLSNKIVEYANNYSQSF